MSRPEDKGNCTRRGEILLNTLSITQITAQRVDRISLSVFSVSSVVKLFWLVGVSVFVTDPEQGQQVAWNVDGVKA